MYIDRKYKLIHLIRFNSILNQVYLMYLYVYIMSLNMCMCKFIFSPIPANLVFF